MSVLPGFDCIWSFKLIFKGGRRLSFPFSVFVPKRKIFSRVHLFIYFTVGITLETEDTLVFLTEVELDPYRRCHRNVAGLEEFLNKTNTGLL